MDLIGKLSNPLARSRANAARADSRARLRDLPSGSRTALLIPPTRGGSIGDAAMLMAACRQLRAIGFTSVSIASPVGPDALPGFDEYLDADGWFYKDRQLALLRLLRQLGGFSHSFLIGADCLDGRYNLGSICRRVALLDEHAKMGGRCTILGASFSAEPNSAAIARLRQLSADVDICARDPVSRERMERHLQRPVRDVADLAFLTVGEPQSPGIQSTLDFIDRSQAAGRSVVALNINRLIAESEAGFVDGHVALMRAMVESGHSILLVPHDDRGETNDHYWLLKCRDELSSDQQAHIFPMTHTEPSGVQAALARTDFLVTSRMHAAILAMSAGIPAASFAYQGKFEGLYQLMRIDECGALFPATCFREDSEGTIAAILDLIDRRGDLRAIVERSLPEAKTMALANFDRVTAG